MDAIDIIENDTTDTSESTDTSFGKEIAKSLTISTAQTAGMIVGAMAVAYAYSKVKAFRNRKAVVLNIVTDDPENSTETAEN